jgi:outer membrane protein assembly factor BamB
VAGGAVYFGSLDGRIYALDAVTGVPRWKYGVMTQGTVENQPTVSGDRVFAGSGDGRLYALSAASGGEYWRYSTTDAIFARPVLAGDRLYVASNGQTMAALDPVSGDPAWEQDLAGPITFQPALAGATLYYVLTSDPHLYAADAGTGKLRWQFDTGDWLAAGPLVGANTLYLAGKDGTVLAYGLGN